MDAIVIHRDRRMVLITAANRYSDVTRLPFFESVFDSIGREFAHHERPGSDVPWWYPMNFVLDLHRYQN